MIIILILRLIMIRITFIILAELMLACFEQIGVLKAMIAPSIFNTKMNTRKTLISVFVTSLFCAPSAFAQNNDAIELDKLVVSGTNQSSYVFDEADSATGFTADVDDLPRTIQVIPEQLIIDQNSDDLTDVLSNAAGVTRSDGFGGTETEVNIRGFTNNRTFVDGNPVSNRYNIEVADVERAEVLLGPASILHGQVSPGGLINIVTKKPEKESAHSIQAEFDEHGKQKVSFDSTGSLSEKFQYRFVVTDENSDSFREVSTTEGTFDDGRESLSISPSISYTPTENDTITLRLNYTEQTLPIDRGSIVVNDGLGNLSVADIPDERRLTSEFDLRDSEETRIRLNWDHTINDNWINKFAISYFEKEFKEFQTRAIVGFDFDPGISDNPSVFDVIGILTAANTSGVGPSNLLGRNADSADATESDFTISNSLVGDFQIGGIENTLYIGANYYRRDIEVTNYQALTELSAIIPPTLSAFTGGTINIGNLIPSFNVLDITSPNQAATVLGAQTELGSTDTTSDEYGLSIQNLVKVSDKLNILLGLRYDHFDTDQDFTVLVESLDAASFNLLDEPLLVETGSSNSNLSGQAGITYDINDNVTVYASYAESFTPNVNIVTRGVSSGFGDIDPEDAKQVEIGVKTNFFDDKLRFSIAAYELTRENVLDFDENFIAQLNGEEETQGIDISSSVQFIPGLNILASYSYLDSEIVDDNSDTLDNEGNSNENIPKNKARLWGSYELQEGSYAGLGFGLGAEYVDSRFGNDANTFELPSYTIFDAAVWAHIQVPGKNKLRLQAGIKNLTDKEYFSASGGSVFRVNVGDPRTFYATARLEF